MKPGGAYQEVETHRHADCVDAERSGSGSGGERAAPEVRGATTSGNRSSVAWAHRN